MAIATQAAILYIAKDGLTHAALYTTKANANADLAAINAALQSGNEVVLINGNVVNDEESKNLSVITAIVVTPA